MAKNENASTENNNASLSLTVEEINDRVNKGGNKFTKAEMKVFRADIKAARDARKARFGGMTVTQITAAVSELVEAGYKLEDWSKKELKSKDVVTPKFTKSKGTLARAERAAELEEENASLKARLEALEKKLNGGENAVEGIIA